jgi:hypothetical protein
MDVNPLLDSLEFNVFILTSNENPNSDRTLQVLTRMDKGISVLASFSQLNHSKASNFSSPHIYNNIFVSSLLM